MTKPVAPQPPSLTPQPGDNDPKIRAWMDVMFPPTSDPDYKERMQERAYAEALYRTRPSRYDAHAYNDWYDNRLSADQRKILDIAGQKKSADPKVIAKKAEENAAKARERANDPEYQQKLADKRAKYAQEVEAQGGEVRGYRHGGPPSPAAKKAERNERNKQRRARIRDDLTGGRNPFDADKTPIAHEVARILLEREIFDLTNDTSDIAEIFELTPEDALKKVMSAKEILRTAQAIRTKKGTIVLRTDASAGLKNLPTYGIV